MSDFRAYVSKTTNDINSDVQTAMEAVHWASKVKEGSTVFIKPNFTFYEYRPGVTTTPEVLRALITLLKTRAGRVIVGESDGGNRSFTADQAFIGHGLIEMSKELGFELVNLSKLPAVDIEESIQGINVKVELPKLLLEEIDTFISVPVLKVHAMTRVTLSMKNLWGCYPDTMRGLHHKNLSRKLALITKKLEPGLILIDGIYALDEHGPMYGTPRKVDLLLSADNPVVADALGANIMCMDLKKVEHIMMAEREGLGTTDINKVQINPGWETNRFQCRVKRTYVDNLSTLLFNSEFLAKLVMDSPFKPMIYGIAGKLRTKDEQKIVGEIEGHKSG